MQTIRTDVARAAFLDALSQSGNVTASCKAARVARAAIYVWRSEDKAFAADWDAALELGIDALEDEAMRRAHKGTLRPVYQNGKKVGTVREYSDTLTVLLLKARRPDRYRDHSKVEYTGAMTIRGLLDAVDGKTRGLPSGD